MAGWVKLHRKLERSQMYCNLNSKQRDVMIQCLLMANHQKNEWMWCGEIFSCSPGQFITSLDELTKRCARDIKVQSVRTALLVLSKWGFLTNKSTKTGRLITVLNWDTYQCDDNETNNETNKELTKSQQRANKQLTPNKNDKEGKEGKEYIYSDQNSKSRFTKPTEKEVADYCKERNNNVVASVFLNHYDSNGWMVGKTKMKNWKAAVRTWENYGTNKNQERSYNGWDHKL